MAKRQLRIVHEGAPPREGPPEGADRPALETLLERGLTAIVALTGARGGAVRLLEGPAARLRLVAASGVSQAWLHHERDVASDCGVCGRALLHDAVQQDIAGDPCARAFPSCGSLEAGPTLALPLHVRGRASGVFNLFFAPGSPAGADVSRLLAPVSDMLDLVVENAVLERERLESSLVAERQMLAAEVHDSLAQGLAYMRMRMTLLEDAIEDGDRDRALKYFGDVSGSMGDAHRRLRQLITEFRGGAEPGLARALEGAAVGFEDRTGVALAIDNRVSDLRLAPEQELQVYRIVQEALANVVKHARAAHVRVVIERRADKLHVSVEDDGQGVAPAGAVESGDDGGHYGLEIMRERAQRVGGEIRIQSVPGKGTRVRLTMPATGMTA